MTLMKKFEDAVLVIFFFFFYLKCPLGVETEASDVVIGATLSQNE